MAATPTDTSLYTLCPTIYKEGQLITIRDIVYKVGKVPTPVKSVTVIPLYPLTLRYNPQTGGYYYG